MNILARELSKCYEYVEPMTFYRSIFPDGELDVWGDLPDERTKGKYAGIAVEITNEKKQNGKWKINRYTVTDDLDTVDQLMQSDNFCILAPISYAGKSRNSKNARIMYALVVELDNLRVREKSGRQEGLYNLIEQWSEKVHWIPQPTYLVASGTGVHLYYVFERGIPLFDNVVSSLQSYKKRLTEMVWNRHVTYSYTEETIQQESIFQGFRMVGTVTKKGDRVEAFRVGDRVSIEYMNRFVDSKYMIDQVYKSELTLAAAKEKYADWYERRIVNREPKGHWICKRDLYDWWKRRVTVEAVVGHRYYCLMMLAIYAIKCDISREELETDCFELMEIFEERTVSEENHFTEKDVIDALQSFEDKDLITYPINSIANRSGLKIEKNKRNGRKQKDHVILMNTMKNFKKQLGEPVADGRPDKERLVKDYLMENPGKSVTEIARVLGISRTTVYKYMEKK